MKKVLLLTAVLLGSLVCQATPPVFVRSGTAHNSVTGTTLSIASQTTTAGNLGIVFCSSAAVTGTISVADGGTDTFVAIGTASVSTSENANMQSFLVQSLAGGSKTLTCTFSVSSNFHTMMYYELSGQNASALDVTGFSNSDSNTSNAPTVTLTTAVDTVAIAFASCGNTCIVGTGATACTPNACTNGLADTQGDEAELQTNAAGGSTSMVLSQSLGNYLMVATSFKGAGAGGGPTPPVKRPLIF